MPSVTLLCDGGCLGNHLASRSGQAYGSFIIVGESLVRNLKSFDVGLTNNDAEYLIIISALETIRARGRAADTDVTIQTDSALVIGQMTQNWKVKAPNLLPHIIALQEEMKHFRSVKFEKVSGQHVKKVLGH
jgi:ribonuclease HI